MRLNEDLLQAGALFEQGMSTPPPVIEVARYDHPGPRWHILRNQVAEHVQLLAAMGLQKAQVYADGVYGSVGQIDHAMQQTTPFRTGDGNIAVLYM